MVAGKESSLAKQDRGTIMFEGKRKVAYCCLWVLFELRSFKWSSDNFVMCLVLLIRFLTLLNSSPINQGGSIATWFKTRRLSPI